MDFSIHPLEPNLSTLCLQPLRQTPSNLDFLDVNGHIHLMALLQFILYKDTEDKWVYVEALCIEISVVSTNTMCLFYINT